MRRLLFKNSVSGIFQLVLTTILVFISVSLFNRILGSEIYGLFAALSIIGNLNLFTNLGINSALLIFLSENGKGRNSDHNIIVGFTITLIISIPTTILIIFFNKFIILNILGVSKSLYDLSYWLFILLVISNSIIFIGQVFTAMLDSMQKMYITNMLQLFYNILYNSSIIIIIISKGTIFEIGIAIFICSIIWFAAISSISLKSWGVLDFKGLKKNFGFYAKEQLLLGSKVYTSGIIFFFYEPITKILIARLIGITEVGFFDISLKIRNQLWGLIQKAGQPVLPLISKIKDHDKLRYIVHNIEQIALYIIIPILPVIIFCLPPVIRIWIGGSNSDIISFSSIVITCSFLLFSSTVIPMYLYLTSKGHATKTIYIQLTNSLINLLIIISTYSFWGYTSFIIGNAISILGSFILIIYYQKKILNSLILDNFKSLLKLSSIIIIEIALLFLIDQILKEDILKIIIIPIANLLITVTFYYYFRVVSEDNLKDYIGKNKYSDFLIHILCRKN